LPSTETKDHSSPENYPSQGVTQKPTIEVYKRFLRKKGWHSCESSFLWQTVSKLKSHFSESFTRSEQFQYLVEVFGHNRTRREIRWAMYILYKAGLIIQEATTEDGDPILRVEIPASEKLMSRKVDFAILQVLCQTCKFHQVPFVADLLSSLLINNYSQKELAALIQKVTHS